MIKSREENLVVAALSCLLAIVGVMVMRMVLKLDFQNWSAFYLAAAGTAAIRWTSKGSTLTITSGLRAIACLVVGLTAINMAGYPGASSFQTASLLPREIMEALGYFHVYYDR